MREEEVAKKGQNEQRGGESQQRHEDEVSGGKQNKNNQRHLDRRFKQRDKKVEEQRNAGLKS